MKTETKESHLNVNYKDGRVKTVTLSNDAMEFSLLDLPSSDWDNIVSVSGKFPDSLKTLYVHPVERPEHTLTAIPDLPASLKVLSIAKFAGPNLPDLPDALEELCVYSCRDITNLPALPASLKALTVFDCNSLTNLPTLPQTLQSLDVSQCHSLVGVPALPSGLERLSLIMNEPSPITELPEFPSSLRETWLRCDKLAALPQLPSKLQYFTIDRSHAITELPAMPKSLKSFHVVSCSKLRSLPVLPRSLTQLFVSESKELECIPDAFLNVSVGVLRSQTTSSLQHMWSEFVQEYQKGALTSASEDIVEFIQEHGHQDAGRMLLSFGFERFVEVAGSAAAFEIICGEGNAETRRLLIAKYGWKEFMLDSKAQVVHEDDFGVLYSLQLRDDILLMMVKVVNATVNADGSYSDYCLMVDSECRPMWINDETGEISYGNPQALTAHNAVASTFGLYGEEYSPEMET